MAHNGSRHNGDIIASGDWTPALSCVTPGDLSVSYTTQVGRFVRVGQLVFLRWNITTSAFTYTTASGSAIIAGIPVSPSSANSSVGAYGGIRVSGYTKANYTMVVPQIIDGAGNITLIASGSAQTVSTMSIADFPTGGSVILRGSLLYEAA